MKPHSTVVIQNRIRDLKVQLDAAIHKGDRARLEGQIAGLEEALQVLYRPKHFCHIMLILGDDPIHTLRVVGIMLTSSKDLSVGMALCLMSFEGDDYDTANKIATEAMEYLTTQGHPLSNLWKQWRPPTSTEEILAQTQSLRHHRRIVEQADAAVARIFSRETFGGSL